MLFLHGSGERGRNLEDVKRHGPPKLVEQGRAFGTWNLALAQPERFAAIAPVCGRMFRDNPRRASLIQHVPVWVFHGAQDDVVPLSDSEKMVNALKECGGDVRFTVYPETGHDAWTETYNNPELYRWLLSRKRSRIER